MEINDEKEELQTIGLNDYSSTQITTFLAFESTFKHLMNQFDAIKLEISSELKYFVIEKLKKYMELKPSDIVIQLDSKQGWKALFNSEGKTYAFLYDIKTDTWVTKHLRKPIHFYLTKEN